MRERHFFWRMLGAAIWRRRSRAAMAVVSSAVGAATLFCLTAVCVTVPAQMSAQMRQFGANLVVVPVAVDGVDAQISDAQADAVTGAVSALAPARAATYRYETVRINRAPYTLAGIDVDATRALNGHWDVEGDWPAAGQVLVGVDIAQAAGLSVGSAVTLEYGTDEVAAGTASDSGTTPDNPAPEFRISGILSTGSEEDDIVYAPAADVASLTGSERGWDVVEMSVDTTAAPMDSLVAAVDASDTHLSARPVSKVTSADTRIVTMLGTLFWVVSVVVLALTLVGVSTTMTVVVAERRKEIGLRKALGAADGDVAREFYSEAALYGLIGGIIGTAIGYGLAYVVSVSVFDRSIGFDPLLGAGSILLAVGVAVLAAWAPVRRAARIDPAVVLKEE